ncbi:unnamed protein product [Spirodela intermedia]|uniref:Large ribosomal subunit protein uL1c n=1 Tax=Spirodela intermedia TaxID=51605 RepID=A0A7I8KX74_SPIIN|nr:unnamed protein product [Spirodela intermedia]
MAPPPRILLSYVRRHSLKCPPLQSSRHLLYSPQSPRSTSISAIQDVENAAASSSGLAPLLGLVRSLSSSGPIKPISYPVKLRDEEDAPPPPESFPAPPKGSDETNDPQAEAPRTEERIVRAWTREDARYVKDVPVISPVSYAPKVAPLPEDKGAHSMAEGESITEGDEQLQTRRVSDEQLQRESRRIEASARLRRALLIQQEEDNVPFPTLIKPEKNKPKAALDLQEAIREVKANAKRNFVETVEAHVNLGVDPRRGDQMVRGAVTLPHGTGKVVRVAVFAEGPAAEEARAAGADIVGGDELIEAIMTGGGKINFDKCIAIPSFMPRLGKIARILGPRGLMPNPKLGSVTSDVSGAVKAAKCGRVDFKIDKTAIIHVGLGKVSFSEEALRENIAAFVNALLLAKPVGLKKTSKYAGYMNSFSLCSTMGPGFPVSIQSISAAADSYTKVQGK